MTQLARLVFLFGRRHDAGRDAPRNPRAMRTIAYLQQKNIPAAHNAAVIARLRATRAADRNLARMAELEPLSAEWMMELYAALEIAIGQSDKGTGDLARKQGISGRAPSPDTRSHKWASYLARWHRR